MREGDNPLHVAVSAAFAALEKRMSETEELQKKSFKQSTQSFLNRISKRNFFSEKKSIELMIVEQALSKSENLQFINQGNAFGDTPLKLAALPNFCYMSEDGEPTKEDEARCDLSCQIMKALIKKGASGSHMGIHLKKDTNSDSAILAISEDRMFTARRLNAIMAAASSTSWGRQSEPVALEILVS